LLTPARIAQVRSYLSTHPFTPKADDYLGQALLHVANGSSCSNAINFAITTDIPTSGVASDEARFFGEFMILVYDWCFDVLTAGEKATLVSKLNTAFAALQVKDFGGPDFPENNYFWGYLRNELEWGIASKFENGAADGFLFDALETRFSNSFKPHALTAGLGGIPHEGTEYGSAMGSYPLIPFISAGDYGRDPYAETDYFKQMVFYTIYSTTSTKTFNVTDGQSNWELLPFNDDELFVDGGIVALRDYYQDFMTFAANKWNSIPVGKYARQWTNQVGATPSFLIRALDTAPTTTLSFTNLPLDFYGTGIKYLYGRSSWNPGATLIQVQMGEPVGVGHAHEDLGNWDIWRGGRWLSRESTGYANVLRGYGGVGQAGSENLIAHNTIAMNQKSALPGIRRGPAVVRRLESRNAYTYANVDLSDIYRSDDGHPQIDDPTVSHVEREFLFLRDFEALIIFDRLAVTTSSVKRTFIAHFETNPAIEDANHVSSTNGSQLVRVSTLLPATPPAGYRVVNENTCAGCSSNGQYRLELDDFGATQSYFLNVLQARDAAAGNMTSFLVDSNPGNPASGTYTLTLNHPTAGTAVIVFNKGTVSAGGTVTVNGSPNTLINGVQTISYTDNGPIWLP